MNKDNWKQILASAAVLGIFGILGTTLVALTWSATADRIALNQQQAFLRNVHKLVPHKDMDNDLLKDAITVTAAELSPTPVKVYRARKQGKVTALIFSPVVSPGYAGPIRIMVGIRADGVLGGVRILSQMETPGLGDKIDENKTDWVLGFTDKSIGNPPLAKWKVKKDGGVFDQFTGATITPRKVVNAVRQTLVYFQQHRQELFDKPAEHISEMPFH